MKEKLSPSPDHRDMMSYKVVSVPNGRNYGVAGHVPCDHILVAIYPQCTRTYQKIGERAGWTVNPKV